MPEIDERIKALDIVLSAALQAELPFDVPVEFEAEIELY